MRYVGYIFTIDKEGITFLDQDGYTTNHLTRGSGIEVGDEFEAILTEEGNVCLRRKTEA
tara:strand:- start:89 stop:265 length:177 start_codon:yes stop_codon:yes gene_type:complete